MNVPAIIKCIDDHNLLIKILLLLGNESLNDSIETFLLRKNDPQYFLLFLKEKVKRGLDTNYSEELFITLDGIHRFHIRYIDEFLRILGKKPGDLVIKLLACGDYSIIDTYLHRISRDSLHPMEDLQSIVPALTTHFSGGLFYYLIIVIQIISMTNQYTYTLLNDCKLASSNDLNKILGAYFITVRGQPLMAIRNYCDYIYQKDPIAFYDFDKMFVLSIDGTYLLQYSYLVKKSNKRHILQRLVALKKEDYLINFIRMFPEYKHLLPML